MIRSCCSFFAYGRSSSVPLARHLRTAASGVGRMPRRVVSLAVAQPGRDRDTDTEAEVEAEAEGAAVSSSPLHLSTQPPEPPSEGDGGLIFSTRFGAIRRDSDNREKQKQRSRTRAPQGNFAVAPMAQKPTMPSDSGMSSLLFETDLIFEDCMTYVSTLAANNKETPPKEGVKENPSEIDFKPRKHRSKPPRPAVSSETVMPDFGTSFNTIDQEHFGSLTDKSSTSVANEGQAVQVTPASSDALEDLNVVDNQFFSGAQYINQPVPTDKKSTDKVARLFQESTKEDLNEIDRQLFGQDPARQSRRRRREVPEMRQKSSAMAYVQFIRKKNSSSSQPHQKGKEDFVDELGISLMKKLQNTTGELVRKSSEQEEEKKNYAVHTKQKNLLRKKLRPQNFQQTTPTELELILKNCIIFDMHDIIAINKPYGIPIHEEQDGIHSIRRYLPYLSKRVGASKLFEVHRLDKHTTGILMFAKSETRCSELKELFSQRKIDKRYWALCRGSVEPEAGIVNIPLVETAIANSSRYWMALAPDREQGGRPKKNRSTRTRLPAVTEYKLLSTSKKTSLVEARPITGYKHQIRVHLGQALSCPIIGDHKYTYLDEESFGKPQRLAGESLDAFGIKQSRVRDLPLYLHAKHVQIPELIASKNIWIDANLPHHFNGAMRCLKLTPKDFVKL